MVCVLMITCYETNLQKADFQEEICANWRFFSISHEILCCLFQFKYADCQFSQTYCQLIDPRHSHSHGRHVLLWKFVQPYLMLWIQHHWSILSFINLFFPSTVYYRFYNENQPFWGSIEPSHHETHHVLLLGLFIAAQILKDNSKQT